MTARDVIASVEEYHAVSGPERLGDLMAEKIISKLSAAGYSIMYTGASPHPTVSSFKAGMSVTHAKAGPGKVTKVDDTAVYVEYDRENLAGVYNAAWFEVCGHLLRALPDGGVDG